MPGPDGEVDVRLLDRMRCGDKAAFLKIYERHKAGIFRFAFRLLGSTENAEDITQECFISLMRSPTRFDARKASLRTYLYSAARNLAFKRFRDVEGEVPLEGRNDGESPSSSGPLHVLLAEELSAEVQKAISGLAPKPHPDFKPEWFFKSAQTQELRSLDNIAVDILVNPATGAKVTDVISVNSSPASGWFSRRPYGTSRDFTLDDVDIGVALGRLLVNGVDSGSGGSVRGTLINFYASGHG